MGVEVYGVRKLPFYPLIITKNVFIGEVGKKSNMVKKWANVVYGWYLGLQGCEILGLHIFLHQSGKFRRTNLWEVQPYREKGHLCGDKYFPKKLKTIL